MTPTPQSPGTSIGEKEIHEQIGKLKTDLFKCIGTIESIQDKCRSRPIPQDLVPSIERIGSIRIPILQEDAYLIERVNAGMGEWEYVIQYCGEYYATAPTEEIARSIVEMAQHTCPIFTPMHDATIRREAYERGAREEREKVLDEIQDHNDGRLKGMEMLFATPSSERVESAQDVYLKEAYFELTLVKHLIESLRTPITQDPHIEQFPESP